MLRTLWAALIVFVMVLIMGSLLTLTGFLRFPRPVIDLLVRIYSHSMLFATGAKVRVVWKVAQESLPEKMVVIANHESLLDTQALVTHLPERSIRFVAKKALFAIPLFGWAIKAVGNVPVRRSDTQHDVRRLERASARRGDRDIVFFPEGTRSADGTLHNFKKGAFAFALLHQRPILPIGIAGSGACLAAHSLRPRPGLIVMVVGEPISVEGLTYDERDELLERGRTAVLAARDEARALLAASKGAASG
jgi:1-acyl-sn-glycerol-3-phosphate acyltransferase